MLRRLCARILRTPASLPDPASIPLTSADRDTLDESDFVHAWEVKGHAGHAPVRALASAILLPGILLVGSIAAFLWVLPSSSSSGDSVVFERFHLRNHDNSARAAFIPLGATLVDFWVKDRTGNWRDIVLGYDNTTEYLTDPRFPYFGAVVGRVANRIANASYLDPTTHKTVHLPANEHGHTTLHGGTRGYARAEWRVLEQAHDRIVFGLTDHAAEGFPGTVNVRASYTLLARPVRLVSALSARVRDATTPLMLSSHVYWNLDGFQARAGEDGQRGFGGLARDHRLWVDADRYLVTDGELIPTGETAPIARDSPLDFHSRAKGATLGARVDLPGAQGLCGTGCRGLDTALVFSSPGRNVTQEAVARLESPSSGIRLTIRTNQPLLHLFSTPTAPWGLPFPAGLPRKSSHLPHGKLPAQCTLEERAYPATGALAVECEGWVGAVHRGKEWVDQGEGEWADPWYGPERAYEWWSEYELSTFAADDDGER